ncbi:MAG TPA: biopolymer transporter ExbD [Flavisolibacter sp.]|jgi:biopolymer transport protein ExbD|nr:biopolymer transporter ExbD [Flavisolibacter sp.]HTM91219.1 biopolymer transporter ExbD [Flavisolibacter sp.]
MNIRRKLKASAEVHTGPLNDILFILLLFFLIASTLANPNLVRVSNPKGDKDMKAKQNIVVTVDKEQKFYIGTQVIPSEQLDTLLTQAIVAARQTIDSPSVVINADTSAYYGEVFRIMRLAKRNGAKVAALVK